MANDHTNESLPSDLKVTRKGDTLILKARTATLHLSVEGGLKLARALTEVCTDHTHL